MTMYYYYLYFEQKRRINLTRFNSDTTILCPHIITQGMGWAYFTTRDEGASKR